MLSVPQVVPYFVKVNKEFMLYVLAAVDDFARKAVYSVDDEPKVQSLLTAI